MGLGVRLVTRLVHRRSDDAESNLLGSDSRLVHSESDDAELIILALRPNYQI